MYMSHFLWTRYTSHEKGSQGVLEPRETRPVSLLLCPARESATLACLSIPTLTIFFSLWVRQPSDPGDLTGDPQLEVFILFLCATQIFRTISEEKIIICSSLCRCCITRIGTSYFIAGKARKELNYFKTVIQHRQSLPRPIYISLSIFLLSFSLLIQKRRVTALKSQSTSARRFQPYRRCGGIVAVSVPRPTRIPRILT
ncbi:hypothetical protein F4804DRAFT_246580 [Jackrogersella minutella]|nr:hypothetical protein F4804DRAFT_246580 [Jackrogersella minutella]